MFCRQIWLFHSLKLALIKGKLRNGKGHKRFLMQTRFHLRLSRETLVLDAMMDSSACSES